MKRFALTTSALTLVFGILMWVLGPLTAVENKYFMLAAEESSDGLSASSLATIGLIVGGIPAILLAWAKIREASTAAKAAESASKLALIVAQTAATAAQTAAQIAQKNLEKTEEVATAVSSQAEKTEGIAKLVDGAASAATAREAALQKELVLMRELLAEKRQTAAVLAAAAVPAAVSPTPEIVIEPVSAGGGLSAVVDAAKVIAEAAPQIDKIEKTTDATHSIVSKKDPGAE